MKRNDIEKKILEQHPELLKINLKNLNKPYLQSWLENGQVTLPISVLVKIFDVGCSSYARASVLYSLYACRHLVITDIEYQTYDDWKNKHQLSLDHKLPKRWFPRLTFDCNNWQPKSIAENINKGDDFLDEGLEKLNFLSDKANVLKQKYL